MWIPAKDSMIGPTRNRVFTWDGKCKPYVLHAHNYDHLTQVLAGSVRVVIVRSDGTEAIANECLTVFQEIVIPKGVKHRIEPLEPGTMFQCIFSHRDKDGVVIEQYAFNEDAYR